MPEVFCDSSQRPRFLATRVTTLTIVWFQSYARRK